MGNLVVDDLAYLGAILRIELAEQRFQVLRVVLALGKNNGLAHQ